jgi:hypothetical protein
LDYAVQLLESSLHTSVAIKPLARGGGRIVIDYADAEDLERLITALRAVPSGGRTGGGGAGADLPSEGDA